MQRAPLLEGSRPPSPTELRISLSARAEFRCSCCASPAAEVPEGALSPQELLTIVRAFARLGIRRIRLTGAGSAARPDLFSLIRRIRDVPGIEEIGLTTSTLHLDVVASRYRDAGVTRLGVAVETLDPVRLRHQRGGSGSLAAVAAGIEAAARARFASLKVNTVVIRDVNDQELGSIVRLAWRNRAVARLIELVPYGRGEPVPVAEVKEALALDGIRLRHDEAVQGWGPAECLRGEVDDGGALLSGSLRLVGPMPPGRCGGCNRARLGPDGTLRRCLSRPVETPLAPLVRAGAGVEEVASFVGAALAAAPDATNGSWQGRAPRPT